MENIENLEKRVIELERTTKSVNSAISVGFEKVNKNFEIITIQLQNIDKELKLMHVKIDNLDGSTASGFGSVEVKLEDLKIEISKINETTGYDGMMDNARFIGEA